MRLTAAIFIIIIITTGCASTKTWYNPNLTQEEARQAHSACRMEYHKAEANVMVGNGNVIAGAIAAGKVFKSCMHSKGFRLMTKEQLARVRGN